MPISDLIHENNIMAHLEAKDSSQAHMLMLQHLADKGLITKDLVAPSQKALQAREDKMTTAMG